MSRTLTASDRKRLIKLASTLPTGSPERKAVLKGLSKTKSASRSKAASTGKIIIEVGEDRDRKSDTFPKGQPYVEFDRSKRYYLVSVPGSPRGGKFGEWRDGYGVMPLEPLAEIAALIYAGKLG